eukprot:PhF_6_TR7794/c0_g1_i1/m.11235/K09549/PFDN2; prefoldin subunit 2
MSAQEGGDAVNIQVYQQYDSMVQDQRAIMNKIAEVDADRHEHSLVLDTLTPMEVTRKCFRLVGGIMVERTVGEVRPMLQSQIENIDQVLKVLTEQLNLKEKQMQEFAALHKLKLKSQAAATATANTTQGVLA